MRYKRDIVALGLTTLIVALVSLSSRGGGQGGGAPPHPAESAAPFSIEPEPGPANQSSAAGRSPKLEPAKETLQSAKPKPTATPDGETGLAASQPACAIVTAKQEPERSELKKFAESQPAVKATAAQTDKAESPSPKPARPWVVEVKANVQVAVDIDALSGDDICDKMADEIILILDNATLYRLSHSGADRIHRLPPKRLSMPLGPDRRPDWLVERLTRVMLGQAADVRVILKPEWEVQIFNGVLDKVGGEPDFAKTRYEVSAKLEATGSGQERIVFVVGNITRRAFEAEPDKAKASLAAR